MDIRSGRAFIVRPFGRKSNSAGEATIDFDKVDEKLIAKALSKVGLSGGTTGEFVQQGNIRSDMFRELLIADLVIADISIHNANAFYELGIRHALRDQYTVMIKSDRRGDAHVFDLKADRYLSYNPDNPGASVEKLVKTIKATLANERADSPVFQLVPGLDRIDLSKVNMVPLKFREKAEQRGENKKKLIKLVDQIVGESWETEGLRLIGRALFKLGAHDASAEIWERIRAFGMLDVEANQKLATNYQKLGKFKLSEQAASRALSSSNLSDWDRAETYALMASNHKTQWLQKLESETDLAKRQRAALTSPFLEQSIQHYLKGFEQHRSHYYSGLNAVAMMAMQVELAKLHPARWALQFDKDYLAEVELEERSSQLAKLMAATDLAIESSVRNYPDDEWARISRADLKLVSSNDPERVRVKYMTCADFGAFSIEALKRQLEIYRALGVFEQNTTAAYEFVLSLEAGDGHASS